VNTSAFDFELPPELIAQEPPTERSSARLMHLERETGLIRHSVISALPALLQPGDLLVVNNTRVFPARLLGHRVPSGGSVECVLVSPAGVGRVSAPAPTPTDRWEALVHPGQKLGPGARLRFDGVVALHAEILERRPYGRRLIRLWTDDGSSVDAAVDAIGHVPLPPYVKRDDTVADRERYQTIFAERRGSVAAPTAGLHFSGHLVAALRDRGVQLAEITLHIGYGTFQPVRVEVVEEHALEPERYEISEKAATAINQALDDDRRVIAVGTTTTRTLESSARQHGGRVQAGAGATDLFIYPTFEFRVIQGLLTNFHLPKSSLLILVSAFAGCERVLMAYRDAVAHRYRFYSYGDAMLLL
jgi:S-adenosylmethionine:tRNA ribosyltransferase-isomerase